MTVERRSWLRGSSASLCVARNKLVFSRSTRLKQVFFGSSSDSLSSQTIRLGVSMYNTDKKERNQDKNDECKIVLFWFLTTQKWQCFISSDSWFLLELYLIYNKSYVTFGVKIRFFYKTKNYNLISTSYEVFHSIYVSGDINYYTQVRNVATTM